MCKSESWITIKKRMRADKRIMRVAAHHERCVPCCTAHVSPESRKESTQ